MADPTDYVPAYSFSGFQANNPSIPLPGNRVDTELADIAAAIADSNNCIQDVRRSDGALKNGIVTPDSLSANTVLMMAGFNPRGAWAALTHYSVLDFVEKDTISYVCNVEHTSSGSFSADRALGYWQVLVNGVVSDNSTVTAAMTTVSRTLAARFADSKALADYGATTKLTVNIPGDYATLQAAFDALYPMTLRTGQTVELMIASGHALTAGLYLTRGDFSGFTISSVDATVSLAASFAYVDSTYRAVMKVENARAPVWNIKVDGGAQIGRGLMYIEQAVGKIEANKGAINCTFFGGVDNGANIYLDGSHVTGRNAVATGGSRGLWASRGSTFDFEAANCDNAVFLGVYASRGSVGSFAQGTARNAGVIGIDSYRSIVAAQESDVSGSAKGYLAEGGGILDAHDGIATGCTTYAVSAEGPSVINARNVNGATAGTAGFRTTLGGRIDKTGATGTIEAGNRTNWLRASGLITDNADDSWPKYTSNSNGEAIQHANGIMECWKRLDIAYLNTAQMRGAWTFPIAFLAGNEPRTTATINSLTMTPTNDKISTLILHTSSVSGVSVDLWRINGMTNFGVSDVGQVTMHAIGRWI